MIGKVYKIIDNTNNDVYYGSTTLDLNDRLNKHKYSYNSYLKNNNIGKCTSINIIRNNDYKIELVELIDNIDDLKKRERYYIENNECINKYIPSRTNSERAKDWYEKNKELCINRSKDYRDNNKEHIKEITKDYREKNKDYFKQYKKEWFEKNRELINTKRREKRKKNKEIISLNNI